MSKRVYFQNGDVFEIMLPDGTFAYGRILLYIRRVSLRGGYEFPHWLASFTGNSMLVRLTKCRFSARPQCMGGIATSPMFPSELLVTRQIRSGELPILGNVPVRPVDIDFPESVCGYGARTMHFNKGAIQRTIPIEFDANPWWDSLPHPGVSLGIAPDLLSRCIDDPTFHVEMQRRSDLRMHPSRNQVLGLFGVSPAMNYEQMCEHFGVMSPAKMIELSLGRR